MGYEQRANALKHMKQGNSTIVTRTCPHCTCDDKSMHELLNTIGKNELYLCNNCSKQFIIKLE